MQNSIFCHSHFQRYSNLENVHKLMMLLSFLPCDNGIFFPQKHRFCRVPFTSIAVIFYDSQS